MSDRINIADACGKTIARTACGGFGRYLAIIFTDDTYSILGACNNYGSTEIEDCGVYDEDLKELGLISADEYENRKKVEKERRAKASEDAERRQYEILKAKFGNKLPEPL